MWMLLCMFPKKEAGKVFRHVPILTFSEYLFPLQFLFSLWEKQRLCSLVSKKQKFPKLLVEKQNLMRSI